jgi:hypothetical protein
MLAGVERAPVSVDSLTLAGAFVLGAVLATVAVLRIVRAVSSYLTSVERRNPPDRDES